MAKLSMPSLKKVHFGSKLARAFINFVILFQGKRLLNVFVCYLLSVYEKEW